MENINFDEYREHLRQAKADAEELRIKERELGEQLERQIAVLNSKAELLREMHRKNNSEFFTVLEAADKNVEDIENRLRKLMLEAYDAKAEDDPKRKQIAAGLSIRVDKKYDYEEQKAIAFAIDRKMTEVLAVDKTKFKKLMAIQPQDFVTVTEVPTPVISFKK